MSFFDVAEKRRKCLLLGILDNRPFYLDDKQFSQSMQVRGIERVGI